MKPPASTVARRTLSVPTASAASLPGPRAGGFTALVSRSRWRLLTARRRRMLWETVEHLWVVFLLFSLLVGWGYLGWQMVKGFLFIVQMVR